MSIIAEAKTCMCSFAMGFLILFLYLFGSYITNLKYFVETQLLLVFLVYIVITNFIAFLIYFRQWNLYHVAVRSLGLGNAFGLGIILAFSDSSFRLVGWYVTALAFFHTSEYLTTALTNPKTLTLGSFLLDHSFEYHVAALMSLVEFTIEWYFMPDYKLPSIIFLIGLSMVVSGELLRKIAMCTAATNFNHYVQFVRNTDHVLITSGIYSFFRHPSYVGWFYWSIGTQVVLQNPVCCIGYAIVSWKFFNHRIYHEEISLLNFFRDQYVEYQKNVPTGLPFIKGYEIEF